VTSTASTATPRRPSTYDQDEITDLLNAAARIDGRHSMKAAVHLLTYTELPGRSDFARHVDIRVGHTSDGASLTGAWVRDWDALLADTEVYLTGAEDRMLQVAASYAVGRPVDLQSHANGLGTAHAKRLIEAVVIGAGVAECFTLNGTARLADLQAQQASFFGPDR
jgi:hypothetical protein